MIGNRRPAVSNGDAMWKIQNLSMEIIHGNKLRNFKLMIPAAMGVRLETSAVHGFMFM